MHPYFSTELANDRLADAHKRADSARLARRVRQAKRAAAHAAGQSHRTITATSAHWFLRRA
jgi:hypothetical protein